MNKDPEQKPIRSSSSKITQIDDFRRKKQSKPDNQKTNYSHDHLNKERQNFLLELTEKADRFYFEINKYAKIRDLCSQYTFSTSVEENEQFFRLCNKKIYNEITEERDITLRNIINTYERIKNENDSICPISSLKIAETLEKINPELIRYQKTTEKLSQIIIELRQKHPNQSFYSGQSHYYR